jgi:hypothetical protein
MVRAVLDEHRRAGVAVLLLSEDLDEIRSLSDRIVVLYEGRIAAEVDGDGADVEELGLAMAGAAPHPSGVCAPWHPTGGCNGAQTDSGVRG